MSDFIILLHTTEYRGDHSAEVSVPINVVEGETVEALIARSGVGNGSFYDWLEIKKVKP